MARVVTAAEAALIVRPGDTLLAALGAGVPSGAVPAHLRARPGRAAPALAC